ncbi:hypothetical protein B5807_00709 [Epicoccum nigrum]|uniref:Uncharacterized protein n=1 Tax=Epicoccum nigrum TaxID=105696 RepID=A0A1Y2MC05_EPING|nr:hypothetical protein B5807_00709 [Epicoccum nigrum]
MGLPHSLEHMVVPRPCSWNIDSKPTRGPHLSKFRLARSQNSHISREGPSATRRPLEKRPRAPRGRHLGHHLRGRGLRRLDPGACHRRPSLRPQDTHMVQHPLSIRPPTGGRQPRPGRKQALPFRRQGYRDVRLRRARVPRSRVRLLARRGRHHAPDQRLGMAGSLTRRVEGAFCPAGAGEGWPRRAHNRAGAALSVGRWRRGRGLEVLRRHVDVPAAAGACHRGGHQGRYSCEHQARHTRGAVGGGTVQVRGFQGRGGEGDPRRAEARAWSTEPVRYCEGHRGRWRNVRGLGRCGSVGQHFRRWVVGHSGQIG